MAKKRKQRAARKAVKRHKPKPKRRVTTKKRPAGDKTPRKHDRLLRTRDRIRSLKAEFDAADAAGAAALREHDLGALTQAIDRETAITNEQSRLVRESIAAVNDQIQRDRRK